MRNSLKKFIKWILRDEEEERSYKNDPPMRKSNLDAFEYSYWENETRNKNMHELLTRKLSINKQALTELEGRISKLEQIKFEYLKKKRPKKNGKGEK